MTEEAKARDYAGKVRAYYAMVLDHLVGPPESANEHWDEKRFGLARRHDMVMRSLDELEMALTPGLDGVWPAWKVVEIQRGHCYFAVHGLEGIKKIPTGTWLQAEEKTVTDGSRGTKYKSGFHVCLEAGDALKYLELFTSGRPMRVARVLTRGKLRRKEHARGRVWLAKEMLLPFSYPRPTDPRADAAGKQAGREAGGA